MAIDNPLDQARAQIEAEKREADPLMDRLASAQPFLKAISVGVKLLRSGGLGTTADLLKEVSQVFSRDRSKYLLDVVIGEVQTQWERYDRLNERQQAFLNTDWLELLGDADRKARVTRGKDKIMRIARIISGAAYAMPPNPPDETEELMRVAMSLDDRDVLMLRIIVEHQSKKIAPGLDRVTYYSAFSTWPHVVAGARNCEISHGELDAICGKLESFGLVSRGERTTNIHGNDPVPFALLLRGVKFLEQVHFSASNLAPPS